ncbi:hypothetical protein A2276_04105 [candidate division WOR-1 bacterium RIFOXYA12_FULL_43_27]|uniref:Uncharacterized protein n=1 Tax=candidate division WOR-1 bacterium RIFOXYC2_FULL_46_14 TaxID=1802587 RepID=A0A1F4U760_UNCSA|nr:MAG: hypothetical protein A2276_04105 [candidate division WOR-1 bacterium RIFOXYA12_FULL_43_27]OGC19127.1 MAG: hypothetical protein A2292_00230 [candidate division WOR-1 bacterium RIFOXYB2_FULL_46_45]OGC30115.1 MAG: hypothetical protein A2232_00230 [candidate division WOR-1 bacterium RIFOXYA2_FULL_46_56]OGC40717.1 MAG: hypothetical protein A2438_00235 [candidate division WOR-1 bacterium RIFOXYC2_FULL_46_14]
MEPVASRAKTKGDGLFVVSVRPFGTFVAAILLLKLDESILGILALVMLVLGSYPDRLLDTDGVKLGPPILFSSYFLKKI